MTKRITDSQVLGELGETAVKKLVLEMNFIYDHRGRLEAGTDGIIELRDPRTGSPLGKLLGVQVKSTETSQYTRETSRDFEYLLRPDDLAYWKTSNVPVIIVVWRNSDQTAFWKDVTDCVSGEERRLKFDKQEDIFDQRCADRIASLTIDRGTPGVFLPPLNQGEEAIVNLLRIRLPSEIFLSTSPFGSGRDAVPELYKQGDIRWDWVIRKRRFVSFFDPREFGTKAIVDLDQVEAIETRAFTLNDELDDQNDTIELLRRSLVHQLQSQLNYSSRDKIFYFKSTGRNKSRKYTYMSNIKETSARVVSFYRSTKKGGFDYVRHHAVRLRFERFGDEWFVVIEPDFFFTKDGFQVHPHPDALLAGKKRLERNAAVRGQVIMWQNLLVESGKHISGLFDATSLPPTLNFERLPAIWLPQAVPESAWNRCDPHAKDMESPDLFEDEVDQ